MHEVWLCLLIIAVVCVQTRFYHLIINTKRCWPREFVVILILYILILVVISHEHPVVHTHPHSWRSYAP